MLKSRIIVDLPSVETDRKKKPLEWLRSLFGAKVNLGTGREAITVSAMALVNELVQAFTAAGVTDVISLVIDGDVIYLDQENVPDDLELMHQAALESGVLAAPFNELHVALALRTQGVHVLIDVQIENPVLLGEEEMVVRLSGRLEGLRPQQGESAQTFAERARRFTSAPNALEPYRHVLDTLTQKIASQFEAKLTDAVVTTKTAWIEIIRPDILQIGRFRHLDFGDPARKPHYRPQPLKRLSGAYADPFFYFFDDAYYDLTCWILLDGWANTEAEPAPMTFVISPAGEYLGTAEHVEEVLLGWAGSGAVRFDDDGSLVVRSRIPEAPERSEDVGTVEFGYYDITIDAK